MSNIKVHLNKSKISNINKKGEKALETLANAIVEDAPIPVDTGDMESNVSISKGNGKVTITHNQTYSQRQYYHPEYNHKNGESEWYKSYLNGSKKNFMIDIFRGGFK